MTEAETNVPQAGHLFGAETQHPFGGFGVPGSGRMDNPLEAPQIGAPSAPIGQETVQRLRSASAPMKYGRHVSLGAPPRGRIAMSHFLSELPLWQLILAVVVIPALIAIGIQVLVQGSFGVERLALNNEVAGFIFAIIGVVYAVLLAFVVIAVWEKFSEGQTSVAKESAAAAALFYYSEGDEPEAAKLRESLVHYLESVIEGDWPAMGRKSEDSQTTDALNALYRAAMALNRTGTRSIPDMSEVFAQIDNLTLARRVRLHLSTGLVPEIIWITLFAGAGLTVCFALFFGSPNRLAQLAMTGVLSIVLASGLVVIIALDHPFSGPVHIAPEALERVLAIAKEG